MVTHVEATIRMLSIHKVGNKMLDEPLTLSDQPLDIDDDVLDNLLRQYFLSPFEKTSKSYQFYHPTGDQNLNEVFHFAEKIFKQPDEFHESSKQIARHLFDISNHPKIKSGELYFTYFEKLQIEGELFEAIGIFKSETKEPYLTVSPKDHGFTIQYQEQAINIRKLDKGCIIFNTEKEEGYKVVVLDQTNATEAVYWVDDFLKLKVRNDNYNQTETILGVYKNFVTQSMDEEFDITNPQKIDLLNRSIKYFKEKDHFDMNEFSTEVISDPAGIDSFRLFKQTFEEEHDTTIDDAFSISDAAVKKQARNFKSVLKLDKNFHIYIHGNTEMIEKGFDENKKMSFYKVYFREER